MTDPISDMLTRIRNASSAGQPAVLMPMSKMKRKIAELMKAKSAVLDVLEDHEGSRMRLKIVLRYIADEKGRRAPWLQGIRRVSRQGQRIYVKKGQIPYVKSGYGFAIISTSKGLMADSDARRAGLGGEIICEVW